MDSADIEAKVLEFIASKVEDIDVSKISISSQFEELGLDSLDTVQLLFDAEETFGVNFAGEEIKNFRCVGDIIDYIGRQQPPVSV